MSNDDDDRDWEVENYALEAKAMKERDREERQDQIDQLAFSFQKEAYIRVLAAATGSLMRSETLPPYDVQALANDAANLAADSADKWFRENIAL